MKSDNIFNTFRGYFSPNYTQVPDELFDEHLPYLSGAELKVLMYIIRRTFGFKKNSDNISFNQICKGIITKDGKILDKGTGLSSSTAQAAIKGLIKKNIIIATRRTSPEKGNEPTTYSLNSLLQIPYGENRHRGVSKIDIGLWRKSTTQDTVLQKTDIQYRNSNSKLVKNESNYNKGYQNFKAVGELLKNKTHKKEISFKEIPEQLKVAIDEISREFGEERNIHSNLIRLIHIIQRSGRSLNNFTSYLYEARSITKQQGNVKKKIPYFFKILEDLSGIKNL